MKLVITNYSIDTSCTTSVGEYRIQKKQLLWERAQREKAKEEREQEIHEMAII